MTKGYTFKINEKAIRELEEKIQSDTNKILQDTAVENRHLTRGLLVEKIAEALREHGVSPNDEGIHEWLSENKESLNLKY